MVSGRVRWTAVAVAVGTLLFTPAAANADPTRPRPLASAIAALAAASQPPPRSTRSRDSLKNGAIIGAVVGAAALGGFGLFLCHALDDTGDPNCFPGVLAIAAVGAGIGVGAGVGIDALLVRRAGPAARIHVTF